MNSPSVITGPDDLAQTVRSATDPLDAYPNNGTSVNAPGDQTARPEEMADLINERSATVAAFGVACERYISENPTRSIVVAATAGAAVTALVFAVAGLVSRQR